MFINGVYWSFADIETRVTGLGTLFTASLFVGFTSLNYNDKLARNYVRGTGIAPLGSTRGDYEASGDWEFHAPYAGLIISDMGPRWREIPLAMTVSYGNPISAPGVPIIPIRTDILQNVYLTDFDATNAEGSESLKRKFSLFIVSPINWGGQGPGFTEFKFQLAVG